MRRLIVALTITLSTLVACAPAVAAQPAPPRTSIRTSATSDPCRPLDKACWQAHIVRRHNEAIWWAEVRKQQNYARLIAYAAAVAASRQCRGYGCVQGIRVCDGPGLVPCYIVNRESRFDPRARNRSSSAGGLYQFLRSWLHECNIRGYSNMADVPVPQQVECSRHAVRTQGLAPWRLTR